MKTTKKKNTAGLAWRIAIGLLLAVGCSATDNRAAGPGDEVGEEAGEVIALYVDTDGEIYWDGECIDGETLALRLSLLDRDDAVALYGDVEESALRPASRSIMETVLRKGIPLVWVEDESRLRLPVQAEGGQARPVTLSTPRIRQALDVYDRALGREDRGSLLSGADIVLRLDPNEEQGYLLRKVEVGIAGQSLWVVHERIGESESTTGIQLKREW